MHATAPDAWTAPAHGLKVVISTHAAARFHERVRPGIEADSASQEFERLLAVATISNQPPAWLDLASSAAPFYLNVGDIVIPLEISGDRLIAVTCICRGGLRPAERRSRHRNAAPRRRGRAGKRGLRKPLSPHPVIDHEQGD